MLSAPIPADEAKRLALLKACKIMYTPSEEAFDDVARLAAQICSTEIALITLVDADQQWFKARVGVEQTGTARDLSFCGHCITKPEPLIVQDTLLDARFADNPLVTGSPHIRFYAGVPLEVEKGSSIGALSVADRSPRTLTAKQLESLRILAGQISRELKVRRDLERAAVPPNAFPVGPGAIVGDCYRLHRELGRGGVGVVFEAYDANGQRFAIKMLLPEWRAQEVVLERFAREARVLMRLTTPHVGKLIDVGNLTAAQGGLPFLVLEYLEGVDLDRLLQNEGRVPFHVAFNWCADACSGVAQAHELGVVHRDLKPSNVFLSRASGTNPLVKVLDFGIAAGEPTTEQSKKLTGVEGIVGSPAYMSPEQMLGNTVDARSDVWSMGALLYEVITGHLPFPGQTELQVFAAAMSRPPLPLRAHLGDNVPPLVEATLLKCLRKSPSDRFASMHELAGALRTTAQATPGGAL